MPNPVTVKKHGCYANPNFNAAVDYVVGKKSICKLAVIHVNKCAGETILSCLRKHLPKESIDIFEYHCFDSNQIIKDLLTMVPRCPSLYFVICTRDPLERWISAFNWDQHDVGVLNSKCANEELQQLYRKYSTVDRLAFAMTHEPVAHSAFKLFQHGHMGMGIAWYLPLQVIKEMPALKTFVIRTEHIQNDTYAVIQKLKLLLEIPNSETFNREIFIPHTKHDYKQKYPHGTFRSLDDMPYSTIKKLKTLLSPDYQSHEAALRFLIP